MALFAGGGGTGAVPLDFHDLLAYYVQPLCNPNRWVDFHVTREHSLGWKVVKETGSLIRKPLNY